MTQGDGTIVQVVLQEGLRFEALNAQGVSVTLDAGPPLGEGAGMSPMELLLVALGGCTAMDVISVLRKKRQEVTDYRVEIGGVRAAEYPKPYTDISIRHVVTGRDLSEDAVRRSIELSEQKYCPIYDMLRKAATISSTFDIRSAAGA